MGWRFRIGPRFARLNFTKSGMSVSTGLLEPPEWCGPLIPKALRSSRSRTSERAEKVVSKPA
jgi:hypothetical protein